MSPWTIMGVMFVGQNLERADIGDVMRDWTTRLFARPSFFDGVARLLDFGDTMTEYNQSLSPQQADELAMRADCEAVAADFRAVFGRVVRERGIQT